MSNALPRTYQELRWADDFDPTGAETASDLESLEQDVMHIISQTLGSNLDDQNRGVGAPTYLGGTADQLAGMPAALDAQLLDDPRIDDSASKQQPDGTYLLTVNVTVNGSVTDLQFVLGPDGLSKA